MLTYADVCCCGHRLEAVREKHYGGPKTEKHKKYTSVEDVLDAGASSARGAPEPYPQALTKEELRKKEEQVSVCLFEPLSY
jgi:hypothetical protein